MGKEKQSETNVAYKGLKLMLLGLAIMLLGGFAMIEIDSGYELLLVLLGFSVTLYGFSVE